MRIRFIVALVGLAISLALPTVAQQKDAVDPKIDQQIRAVTSRYEEAFNRNDASAVATFYTEDAVQGFHGTSHGRQAIEKSYAHYFESWHPHSLVTTVIRVIEVGNEVRSNGRWSETFDDVGIPTNHEGFYSWILVREGDIWKILMDRTSESNPWSVN